MKILLSVLTLVAAAYLLLPENFKQEVSRVLTFTNAEQTSEKLLVDVDTKFQQLAHELRNENKTLLNNIENKIQKSVATLEKQNIEKMSNTTNENLAKTPTEKNNDEDAFLPAKPLAKTQYLAEQSQVNETIVAKENTMHKSLNRQSQLQAIADKMNNTALLAQSY